MVGFDTLIKTLLLSEEVGCALSLRYLIENFPEIPDGAAHDGIRNSLAEIVDRSKSILAVARTVGVHAALNWDHPIVQSWVREGILNAEEMKEARLI